METLQCYLCFTFLLSFCHNIVSVEENDKVEVHEIDTTRNSSFRLDEGLHPTNNLSLLVGPFSARRLPPKAHDWRKFYKFNVLPPPENQNPCHTCYIFGTVYMLEAQYAIMTGKTISFSKQQLVDCNKGHGMGGCRGRGTIHFAYDYLEKYGIMTTKSYGPYLRKDGKCKYDSKKVVATAKDLITFTGHDAFLKVLYNRGPIGAIMIPHGGGYRGGVIRFRGNQCPKNRPPRHMVLIVGYGTTSKGLKYWIIKNTYGTGRGVNGYIKVERGRNTACIEKLGVIAKVVPK